MRGTGKPDVSLGRDRAAALAKWDKLHNKQPLTVGTVQEAIDRWRERELPEYENAETRKAYTKQLAKIEAWCGSMAWHEITLPMMRAYLDKRSAMTQGNREMSVLSIVWGRARLWGMTALPWPAAGVKNWKNEEAARESHVTDELFEVLYAQADQVLRDCMDIATATGMRLTDVRTIRLPVAGLLRFKARKTGKWAEFDVARSPVLCALVERRLAMKAYSVMLLATHTGRQVSSRMLSDRWNAARTAAAKAHPELADQIAAMFLRDMRKRAADLAEDMGAASTLLQHSSTRLTEAHYRTKATRLKAVR
ncbi:integrase [Variovorax terrae]|uniref:Integrase n=1 Tax=Variovorax terrae TaxID=2923278 RepID=A0A9X1W111_9BURK|nr:integrase [Variovorax terrae]MCJ0764153.1 integrase [Variovorax terrae]